MYNKRKAGMVLARAFVLPAVVNSVQQSVVSADVIDDLLEIGKNLKNDTIEFFGSHVVFSVFISCLIGYLIFCLKEEKVTSTEKVVKVVNEGNNFNSLESVTVGDWKAFCNFLYKKSIKKRNKLSLFLNFKSSGIFYTADDNDKYFIKELTFEASKDHYLVLKYEKDQNILKVLLVNDGKYSEVKDVDSLKKEIEEILNKLHNGLSLFSSKKTESLEDIMIFDSSLWEKCSSVLSKKYLQTIPEIKKQIENLKENKQEKMEEVINKNEVNINKKEGKNTFFEYLKNFESNTGLFFYATKSGGLFSGKAKGYDSLFYLNFKGEIREVKSKDIPNGIKEKLEGETSDYIKNMLNNHDEEKEVYSLDKNGNKIEPFFLEKNLKSSQDWNSNENEIAFPGDVVNIYSDTISDLRK